MAKDNKTISLQEAMEIMTNDIKNGGQTIVSDSLQDQIYNQEKELLNRLKKDQEFKNEFKTICKFLYANLLNAEQKTNEYINQIEQDKTTKNLLRYASEILKTWTLDTYYYIFADMDDEPFNDPLSQTITKIYKEATREADEEINEIDIEEERENGKA